MTDTSQQLRSEGAGGITLAAERSRDTDVVTRRGSWLGQRHSLKVESALVVGLYMVYDSSRGVVSGGRSAALAHARAVMALERDASLNVEGGLQRVAAEVPGLMGLFSWGYMGLHLGATVAALLWLHRRGPVRAYTQLRTALLLASLIGLVGFVEFPEVPPRLLVSSGIADTVSSSSANLNAPILRCLYNPYAAMPSLHVAYAVVVGLSVARWAPRRALRALGALYPVWVSVEVIATGNHFLLDVAAGFAVAMVSLLGSRLVVTGNSARPTVLAAVVVEPWAPEAMPFGTAAPASRPQGLPVSVGQHEAGSGVGRARR